MSDQSKTAGAKVLEPCPFCRSSRVDLSWDLYETDEGRRHRSQIRCLDCRVLTKTFKTHADARAYWNASAAPTEQTPTVGGERPQRKTGWPELSNHRSYNDGFNTACEQWDTYVAPLLGEIAQLKAEVEALRKDKDRLDALEANFWDVRHASSPIADTGDNNSSVEIIGHWMEKPWERVIGENYNENLRAALDQAMMADAYPPERPEYPEFDEIPDFGGGGGNRARRRAEELGIDYDAAMSKGVAPPTN